MCSDPVRDCPAATNSWSAACGSDGACTTTNAMVGAACSDDSGKVCDGSGKCIACNAPSISREHDDLRNADLRRAPESEHRLCPLGTTCSDSSGVVCDGVGKCVAAHCTRMPSRTRTERRRLRWFVRRLRDRACMHRDRGLRWRSLLCLGRVRGDHVHGGRAHERHRERRNDVRIARIWRERDVRVRHRIHADRHRADVRRNDDPGTFSGAEPTCAVVDCGAPATVTDANASTVTGGAGGGGDHDAQRCRRDSVQARLCPQWPEPTVSGERRVDLSGHLRTRGVHREKGQRQHGRAVVEHRLRLGGQLVRGRSVHRQSQPRQRRDADSGCGGGDARCDAAR